MLGAVSVLSCLSATAAIASDGLATSPAQKISGPQERYLAVIDALDREGYEIISVNTTLLNRIRIRAENDYHLREIIVSQSSGQILRDVILKEFRPASEPESIIIFSDPEG